jgi:hypothetical protein
MLSFHIICLHIGTAIFAFLNTVFYSATRHPLTKKMRLLTDIVDEGAAVLLKAGSVADQAVAGYLCSDPNIAHLPLLSQSFNKKRSLFKIRFVFNADAASAIKIN